MATATRRRSSWVHGGAVTRTEIGELNRRYAAAASLIRHGAEIVAVGDPLGARLNASVRRLIAAVQQNGPAPWENLLGAAKSLRWRLVTQPQPWAFNTALLEAAEHADREVRRLRGAVADEQLLDDIGAAALALQESDPSHGAVLLQSIEETGAACCVVVAANRRAQLGLLEWLAERGVPVLTPADLPRVGVNVEQSYAAGPPRLFPPSLVTAPATESLTFVTPAWFADRSLPATPFSPYAEGAIRITARVFTVGDTTPAAPEDGELAVDDDLLPQPMWSASQSPTREPSSDEVVARKVLLSGNLAIWLDDGDRIRVLDPVQPLGERVTYSDVTAVRLGTYLLLRRGQTERATLYQAALEQLGRFEAAAGATQLRWKTELSRRIAQQGFAELVKELRQQGISTAERARAWTAANFVRPHSGHDFEILLRWLGISVQPTFRYATMLRQALYQTIADVREQLEEAVSAADLSALERDGHLNVRAEGYRDIIAARVLAISPYTEIVARHEARVPFEDRSGQWLE